MIEWVRSPRLLAEKANIATHIASHRLGILPSGVNVANRDWDTLVIMDACRFDEFAPALWNADEEVRTALDGELERIRSQACYTNQFLDRTFGGRELNDTVYVTGSPHLWNSRHGERASLDVSFHAVYHSWRTDHHPETTTSDAKAMHERFPDKRLVVHYLPPHWPYFGDIGRDAFGDDDGPQWETWTAGRHHGDTETLKTAYRENLTLGLEHVAEFVESVDGKTVVTADHGQLLGDTMWPIPLPGYGHPELHLPGLVSVPYLVCSHTDRRSVTSDPPIGDLHPSGASEENVGDAATERLEALEYR